MIENNQLHFITESANFKFYITPEHLVVEFKNFINPYIKENKYSNEIKGKIVDELENNSALVKDCLIECNSHYLNISYELQLHTEQYAYFHEFFGFSFNQNAKILQGGFVNGIEFYRVNILEAIFNKYYNSNNDKTLLVNKLITDEDVKNFVWVNPPGV